jgi:hypothetical protein
MTANGQSIRASARRFVALFAVAASFGCSSSTAKQDLKLIPAPKTDDSAEIERLRQMENVQVYDSSQGTPGNPALIQIPVSTQTGNYFETPLDTAIQAACKAQTPQACTAATNFCDIDICTDNTSLCFAKTYLSIVNQVGAPPTVGTYTIPPQSAPTNAILAFTARYYASNAIFQARAIAGGLSDDRNLALSESLCVDDSSQASAASTDGVTPRLVSATTIFAESYQTFREATDAQFQALLAASDEQLSSSSSLEQAEARAIAGTDLSRAAAAHVILGGAPGLNGLTTSPFCTMPELGPDATAALSLLRQSGLSPAAVTGALDISTVLNDTGTAVPGGSVFQRLVDAYPQLTPTPSVSAYFSLNDAAFTTARQYMSQEIAAFARSSSVQLPKIQKPGGDLPAYAQYVATVNPPGTITPVYFSALARSGTFSTFALTAPAEVDFIDQGSQTAATLLSDISNLTDVDDSTKSQALAPLALLLSAKELVGRVHIAPIFSNHGSLTTIITVSGYGPSDRLIAVLGEDQLRCATEGTIEGAPCAMDPFASVSFTQSATPDPDFMAAVSVSIPGGVHSGRVYLLQSKTQLGLQSTPQPGQYKALVGVTLLDATTPLTIPIVPGLEQKAGTALEPSRQWCTASQTSCAGFQFDDRLPLEDELTADPSPSEASWRHYLDLAKDAATTADNLANDYLTSGLAVAQNSVSVEQRQQDQQARADDEIATLQKICGTAIDPNQLLTLLGGNTASGAASPTPQSCSATVACTDTTQECIAGSCIVNLQNLAKANPQNPDLQRIADCLDTEALTPFVSLGAHPVCMWVDSQNPNLVCQGNNGTECPVLANGKTCDGVLSNPTGTTPVASTPLNFIQGANGTGKQDVCGALRTLRNEKIRLPGSLEYNTLIGDNTWHPQNLSDLIARISYAARYGGFSAITVDGAAKFETGSFDVGVSKTWPCGTLNLCAPGQTGLFCNPAGETNPPTDWPDCTQTDVRAAANFRMLRAYMAAGLISSGGVYSGDPNTGTDVGTLYKDYQEGDESINKSDIRISGVEPFDSTYGDSYTGQPQVTTPYYTNHAPIEVYSRTNPYVGTYWVSQLSPPSNEARQYWLGPDGTPFPSDAVASSGYFPGYGFSLVTGISPAEFFLAGMSDYRATTTDPGFFATYFQGTNEGGDLADIPVQIFEGQEVESFSLNRVSAAAGRTRSIIQDDMLNGLELLCYISHETDSVSLSSPPIVRTVDDLAGASKYIELLSDTIAKQASLAVFANLPQTGVQALLHGAVDGAYPQFSGDMGASLSKLRGGLEGVQQTIPTIANEVRQFGDQLQQLHDALVNLSLDKDISKLKLASTISENAAQCAGSIGVGSILSLGTLASCANAVAQIDFATSIQQLEGQQTDNNANSQLAAFDTEFATHATNLQKASLAFSQAVEDVNSSLSDIEGSRDSAKLSLARALYLLSQQAQSQAEVTSVLSNLYNGKQMRYQAALQNAKRLAFIAKRAIEQRLGVRLSTLTDDLPLVDAPAKWESSVCSMTGIDYNALNTSSGGSASTAAQSFASGFVGDYVTKLQNVVESYPLVHDFQEGTDTAVVSLRDDLMNVRRQCATPSGNLLYQSVDLHPGAPAPAGANPGWEQLNCQTQTIGTVTSDAPNCVILADGGLPVVANPAYGKPSAFSVTFGAGSTSTTRLAQPVTLNGGAYRFSWYTTDPIASSSGIVEALTTAVSITSSGPDPDSGGTDANGNVWTRQFIAFTVPESEVVNVGFKQPSGVASIVVGSPMLEPLPENTAESFAMKPYTPTTNTLDHLAPACEDTDGKVFRATEWRRDCMMLCPDGYADTCSSDHAVQSCFREASFGFSQRDIQAGKVFNFSGFARGNFNYRIDSLAVNFVGTGIRNCSGSLLPSTCSGAAFVPYTLQHNGPFYVRNDAGADFQAFLFNGSIEHARGLASERYLTNPMSDTDKSLIAAYTRSEFQGRPFDGTFVLRVWEDPAINFEAIQDVQLIFNYRYWTAFH